MRHVWDPSDAVHDLFGSPTIGMLWLRDVDMVDVIDESRQQAADILGTTPARILADEIEAIQNQFREVS